MERFDTVSDYFKAKKNWSKSLLLLREIILNAPVQECLKWSAPAYTYQGKNIIGLAAFKGYVGLWFHQGVFLKDAGNVLINANESNTKGLRQWRFSSVDEIEKQADQILKYVLEAVENQKAGKKIKIARTKVLVIPKALETTLAENESMHKAYYLFSTAKQIEFANYISEAKQEKTKLKRIEKLIPMILKSEGLNDKYRSNKA